MKRILFLILFILVSCGVSYAAPQRAFLIDADEKEVGTATNPLYVTGSGSSEWSDDGSTLTTTDAGRDVQIDGQLTVGTVFDVDGGTLHVDDANDRVGIGTATPDARLKITSSGASDDAFKIRNEDDGAQVIIDTDTNKVNIRTGGSDVLSLGTNDSNDRIYIDADGDVGIGTTTPAFALDVGGDIYASASLTASDVYADTVHAGTIIYTGGSDLDWTADINLTGNMTASGTVVCEEQDLSLSADTTLSGAQMMTLKTVYIQDDMVLGLTAIASIDQLNAVNFDVVVDGTHTCIINPNHVDNFRVDGATESDGESITSSDAADDIINIRHYGTSTASLKATQDGNWTMED